MNRAASIDGFMRRHNLDQRAEEDWRALRSELDVLADYYSVPWRWDSSYQNPPGTPGGTSGRAYRVTFREVDQLLTRVETRSATFRQSLQSALNRSSIDGSRQEDNINEFVRQFERATMDLRDRFRSRRDVTDDARSVLQRAASIDGFMRRHNLDARTEEDWRGLRSDLDQLADYYSVSWRWDNPGTPGRDLPGRNRAANRLTGTYRLDATRSEDVWRKAQRVTRGQSAADRERLRQLIQLRLKAPEVLAIDRDGRNVTVASSRSQTVTFEADGRERVEQTPGGRTVRVSAALIGDQLVVSQSSQRGTDYRATFDVLGDGRTLKVTRSIDMEELTRPVEVDAFYDRTADVAQLNIPRESMPNFPSPTGRPGGGAYGVRDGEQLIAILNNGLNTRQTREGERFTMTVRSPSIYDGAIIEGYVTRVNRSSRLSGRPELSLNFERIRMRNGSTYPFEGFIESVRSSNGDDIRVDNEGNVAEKSSQTAETVTRTGIGAALGALIGAVAGGGKGAAVGAAVGAGAGAGSVFIQGRDDLDLRGGTEFTIRAAVPRNRLESVR
jgi:hypothetical protein